MHKAKLVIVVKDGTNKEVPEHIIKRVRETQNDQGFVFIALDTTQDDLRPMVRGATYEVLYEDGRVTSG